MAKLPMYQQQAMKRQFVSGTAPVDRSLSRGINQFTQGASQLAGTIATQRQREAATFTADARNKAKVRLAEFKAGRENAGETGEQYTEALNKFLEQQKDDLLQTSPHSVASESFNQFWQEFEANSTVTAMDESARINAQKAQDVFTESLRLTGNSVYQNPDGIDDELALIEQDIDMLNLPDDQANKVKKSAMDELTFRKVQGLVDTNPSRALTELESGSYNANLTTDQVIRLTNQARAEVSSGVTTRKAKVSKEITDYLNYRNDGGAERKEFDKDAIVSIYGDEQANQILADIESADKFANNYNSIKYATPEELASIVESELVTGPEDYTRERGQASAITQAVKARNEALIGDPAQYAMGVTNIANQYKEYTSTGNGVGYATATIAEQRRLGMPKGTERILPKSVAMNILSGYNQGGEDAGTLVASLKSEWGEYYPTVMKELTEAGLSPNASVVAILPVGSRAATTLAQADKEGYKVIKDNLGDDFKTISDGVVPKLAEFNKTLYNEGAKQQIKNATELLAMKYYSSGVAENTADAIKMAVDEVVESRYSFVDSYRVPIKFDSFNVTSGVDDVLDQVTEMDLMIPVTSLPSDLAEKVFKRNLRPKVLTLNDDSGVVVVDQLNNPILKADQTQITYTWEELKRDKSPWYKWD